MIVPALGVWVGSSLAAYLNGPVWLACLAGLLLFPLLPLAWETHARWRRAKEGGRSAFFTTWDRIVFRTVAVNLVTLLPGAQDGSETVVPRGPKDRLAHVVWDLVAVRLA